MKRLLISMLAVGLLASACSSDEDSIEPAIPESGVGHINLSCSANPQIGEVIARAESGFALPTEVIPEGTAFNLIISGSYTKNGQLTTWLWPTVSTDEAQDDNNAGSTEVTKTVAEFNTEKPAIEAGAYDVNQSKYLNSYTAQVTYGDPDVEGEGKAYFAGATSEAFSVYPGQTKQVGITASLANSCFTLIAEEWLLKYYDNIELTIHTANNEFTFALNETSSSSPLIFVKSGQKLSFSGKAVKSQTGTSVEFPKTTIGVQLAPDTHYAINVNHDNAGGANLIITFDDNFTEVPVVNVQLNPDVSGGDNPDDGSGEGSGGSGGGDAGNTGGTEGSGGTGDDTTNTPEGN